ncbi:MAG: tripartite tricarboxylate transporter substrate binding protein [Betaproteobacteria bacterium]|nr:tripartite tricarboxylate transporter substrate binding protein [Betaproteobacteria bacterium]
MNRSAWVIAVAAAFAMASTVADAQSSSKRPVRVLVASAPGGPSDTQARLLVPTMSEVLGQILIVDNRPSANGVLATEIASKAVPDGHTLAVGNSGTHAVNATLYRKLPYDPIRDFVPVSQFSTTGMVVAANPRLPGSSIQELAAHGRKQPGSLNVAIAGATGELAGDALWALTQVKMTNVRYKGSSPATLAVISGEADLSLLTPLATLSHIKAGRLKAYGITSSQRAPLLPDLPTMAEQGVQGYDFQFWNGMFAPAKTPDRVVRAVNKSIVQALRDPDVKKRFTELGLVIVGNTPEEFAAVVKRDLAQFRKIIIASGIPRL